MKSLATWFGPALAAGSVFALPLIQVPSGLLAQTTDPLEAPAVDTEGSATPDASPLQPEAPVATDSAILQGLDKITARVSEFEAPIGETVYFGSFEIVAYACKKTPPEEPPESTAFLEITDVRPDEPANVVFKGWMFASSPALSAVEHPVYDVWVTGCRVAPPVVNPTPDENAVEEVTPGEEPAAQ
ncbi:DUF2155 domain-containing protein [Denitrobaculum tricleocarpae]|uniref:DUF2155 domain-containing protein n=1 Tax=Denitrobaculum tricleocarpae TaxID=2591009 RepID=A0A545TWQ6_9PROT|nr:DUF2155 domain-containing protein [Denitrobaculum tricleocarpae]TQV81611.1 DUF2155 domain-containing protein [Denitrobaculum tricleocarpae]